MTEQKQGNAPKLTPDDIGAVIVSAQYHRFNGTSHTVCCLELQNGFTVVGESSCVSPDNFDIEKGRELAYDDARRKVWELEGYLMKERISLSEDGNPFPPLNCAQDAEVANERSKHERVESGDIAGDWRKLLHAVFDQKLQEGAMRKCGKLHLTLPDDILDDIKRTFELGVKNETIVVMAGHEYKVIGTDEDGAIVEAV